MEHDRPNLSTRHQPRGSATNLDDQLDRPPEDRPAGSKRDSATANIDERGRPVAPPGGPR